MGDFRAGEGATRGRRRWRFASALFDEASWTLTVAGVRVAIETKPLELLRALLLRPGEAVTKHELLDAIWPGVAVVEASLPTAVSKLRRVLGDDQAQGRIIETVPRIGYRLAVPVALDPAGGGDDAPASVAGTVPPRRHGKAWLAAAGGLAVVALAGALVTARAWTAAPAVPPVAARPAPVSYDEVMEALHALDMGAIRGLLARGWNPDLPLKGDGGVALDRVLEVCEWYPDHDRRQLMLIVRMLIDHGARIDRRNTFGDTPYSIAKAPRYCGPDHPATKLIHAMCYSGPGYRLRDNCLATYELARMRAQGITPRL